MDKIESVQIMASEMDQQGQWVRGHGVTHRDMVSITAC